ncbi:MAG: hypothetical protein AAF411_31990 [Myxococcota bacterium]
MNTDCTSRSKAVRRRRRLGIALLALTTLSAPILMGCFSYASWGNKSGWETSCDPIYDGNE